MYARMGIPRRVKHACRRHVLRYTRMGIKKKSYSEKKVAINHRCAFGAQAGREKRGDGLSLPFSRSILLFITSSSTNTRISLIHYSFIFSSCQIILVLSSALFFLFPAELVLLLYIIPFPAKFFKQCNTFLLRQ